MILVINPVGGCRYFPPGSRLLSQPKRSPLLADTKLCCLVTECKRLAQGHYTMMPSQDSNQQPVHRKSDTLPIVPPHHLTIHLAILNTSNVTSITEVRSASECLFAGMWHPLVSVITTLDYVAINCHHQVWYRLLSLRIFEVWASSTSPRLPSCQILFQSQPPLLS